MSVLTAIALVIFFTPLAIVVMCAWLWLVQSLLSDSRRWWRTR